MGEDNNIIAQNKIWVCQNKQNHQLRCPKYFVFQNIFYLTLLLSIQFLRMKNQV